MLRGKQLERTIHRAMAAADIPSLSELARRARVQRDTLYAWFRGERPPKPETLKKLADVLGVKPGDLWDYEEVPRAQALSPQVIAEIRALVADGFAQGVAQVLAELDSRAGQQPPRPPRRL